MDTGQLFMQTSVKTRADFTSSVTTMPFAQVAKKETGSFDRVLRESATQKHNRSEQAVRTEVKRPIQKVEGPSDEPIKEEKTSKGANLESGVNVKVDSRNEDENKPVVEKKSEILSLDEQPEVLMPQNVATPIVGVQEMVVQQLQEGRMPLPVKDDAGISKMDENLNVQMQNADDSQIALISKQSVLKTENMILISAEKGEQAEQFSSTRSELKATVDQSIVPKNEPEEAELEIDRIPLNSAVSTKQNLSAEKAVVTSQVVFVEKTESGIEAQLVQLDVAKQKPVSRLEEMKVVSSGLSAQIDTKAVEAAVTVQQKEKQPIQTASTEFKFSRSASVEASLGLFGDVIDQPKEKLVAAVDNSRILVGEKLVEAKLTGFSGSEAGFTGKDAEGFNQQTSELLKPGLLQMTNGQTAGATNFTISNASQVTPQEQIQTASSENVAGQVKAQLSTRNIKQGSEQITIQLSPEHLGDIKVNFKLEDQRLRVEIIAENRTARESLLQHVDSLKESLARQNINMEKFEVSGGSNGNAGQGNNSQPEWREMGKNRQSQQWLAAGGYRTESSDLNPSLPVYFARAENSTLDLHF